MKKLDLEIKDEFIEEEDIIENDEEEEKVPIMDNIKKRPVPPQLDELMSDDQEN